MFFAVFLPGVAIAVALGVMSGQSGYSDPAAIHASGGP